MNDSKFLSLNGLIYYDEKLKRYIKELYGSDMTVEWEPMEDGKNPFKLKIALKNGNGSEIFAKIVDFPLEQTIVSGSYENETKSLILYFQDGTVTKIPISDLIDGLASKLDLDKKANLGESVDICSSEGVISVPSDALPYAKVLKIGGAGRRCNNLLKIEPSYMVTSNGLTAVLNGDGTVTVRGTASAQTTFYFTTALRLPTGNYYFKCNASGMGWNSYWGTVYNQTSKKQSYDTGAGVVFAPESGDTLQAQITVLGGKTLNEVVFKPMINAGDGAIPFEPFFSGVRVARVTEIRGGTENDPFIFKIPEEVSRLEGYGHGNPDDAEEYNYIDFEGRKFVSLGYASDSGWVSHDSPVETDISPFISDCIIRAEKGCTIEIKDEFGYGAPSELRFFLSGNGIVGARELIGNLSGVSEGAKRYLTDTGLSKNTIEDEFSLISARISKAESSSIRVTKSPLDTQSYQGYYATTPIENIINPEGVSVNELVIDKYTRDGSSYLCLWRITEFGADTVKLTGLGYIYAGGGSASVADSAERDGLGRIITETYAEKAYVQNLENEQTALANTVSGLQDSKADKYSLLGYSLKTDTGKTIKMSWEPSASGVNPYKLNLTLENESGDPLSAVQIDFPLEQMVVGAEYDELSRSLILSTPDGQITVPVSDIFKGLVTDSNIINKKAGSADKADYADVASSYKSADGSENTIESIWNRAVASGERANEAYALASEAKGLADSFDTSKASQNEVDALSQAQTEFENGVKDGTVQVHTAKYAPGNRTYTLENAIRNVTYSLGKLSFLRFNAESKEINLLTDEFISSIATALSQNTAFINLVVDAVMREMGYPVNN